MRCGDRSCDLGSVSISISEQKIKCQRVQLSYSHRTGNKRAPPLTVYSLKTYKKCSDKNDRDRHIIYQIPRKHYAGIFISFQDMINILNWFSIKKSKWLLFKPILNNKFNLKLTKCCSERMELLRLRATEYRLVEWVGERNSAIHTSLAMWSRGPNSLQNRCVHNARSFQSLKKNFWKFNVIIRFIRHLF